MIKEWDIPVEDLKKELIGAIIIDVEGTEITVLKWNDKGMRLFLLSTIVEWDGDDAIGLIVAHEFETYKFDKAIKKAAELLKDEILKKESEKA